MSIFSAARCSVQAESLRSAFARNIEAQRRRGQAAESVTRASDHNREAIEQELPKIRARIEKRSHNRPEPPTTDTRRLVEQALDRMDHRNEAGPC